MLKNLFGISVAQSILELFGIVFLRFRPVQKIWAVWLVVVNSVSLLFIEHIEAQVALVAVGVAVLAQALIYQRKGFIRLLGTTHFVWIPMLTWIVPRLETLQEGQSAFHIWLITLIATNVICLAIDALDLTRFMLGERKPYYVW